MTTYATVGKEVPRVDGGSQVTGEAIFCADLFMKGMLYGKILRSPHPHARIRSIDTSKARKLYGVRAVVTGADTLGVKYGPFTSDEYPLAVDKARFIGDEIAAVAADRADIAEEALELIEVDYEILPAVFDPFEATGPNAPAIHDHVKNNIAYASVFQWGSPVDELSKECDVIVEDGFKTHSQVHSYLEPHCSVATWDQNGNITLWASTQGPYYLKLDLLKTLGIPEHKLRIIKPSVGGGFGGKRDLLEPSFCAILLSKLSGRPVKVEYTREEEYTVTRHRHSMNIHLKIGARKDGKFVFFDCRNVVDNGAFNSRGPAITFYAGQALASLYRVQGVRYDCKLVYTNTSAGGAFRGFGNLQMRFALESMVDMVSQKLGMDPLDLRLANVVETGMTTLDKKRVTSCGLRECIEKVRDSSRWREKREKPKKLRGVGIACYDYVSGFRAFFPHDSSSANIKINDDGSAILFTGASDIGQGSDTVLCQIAAEVLGIDMERVKIVSADTEMTPLDLGSYGSRVTFVAGNAVKLAALEARDRLAQFVAGELGVTPGAIRFEKNRVFAAGTPEKGLSFQEATRLALNKEGLIVMGRGTYDPPSEMINLKTGEGQVSPAYSYGAQIAEVEVNPESGEVSIVKVYSATDCGFALNPLSIKGQAEGSIVCAMGMSLYERPYCDGGKILNPSFLDYHIPTSMEMPEIDSQIVESLDPEGPFGAKGVSEGYQVPGAPAIANAVYHATGIRIREVPVNPEEILKGLEKQAKGS
ncbi:MAG: 4-hydroxybenzoyl-CoA reductase [Desulfobacteraceae bacterium]|jgi:4-hydroxybenzoyl-CoA reductase subunit alpha|nr:MAG: 4-hydroxybenzoyl-CoA reductase [Desulfobacteraceae bacterium]